MGYYGGGVILYRYIQYFSLDFNKENSLCVSVLRAGSARRAHAISLIAILVIILMSARDSVCTVCISRPQDRLV